MRAIAAAALLVACAPDPRPVMFEVTISGDCPACEVRWDGVVVEIDPFFFREEVEIARF